MFAGVAEQFAIAEAKLRAWNSVDEEDEEEDCSEEELAHTNELTITTQSSGSHLFFLSFLFSAILCVLSPF